MVGSEIGTNTFCPDAAAFVRLLAEAGYTHVYFSGPVLTQPEEELEQIARSCEDSGIAPFAAHAPGQFLPNDSEKLDQAAARHRQTLDKAATLGCRSVTFHIASVEGVPNEETGRFIEQVGREVFDEMNWQLVGELALHAQQHDMTIAVENLSRDIVANYCQTVGDLKRIIAGSGQPNVGICIDTGHANISGLESSDMIRQAGELLVETHFNDNFGWLSEENAINDLHRPPGVGTVDWLRVIDALDSIGYDNPIIFELGFRGQVDAVSEFLRLTRDNWLLMREAWQYVKAGLAEL